MGVSKEAHQFFFFFFLPVSPFSRTKNASFGNSPATVSANLLLPLNQNLIRNLINPKVKNKAEDWIVYRRARGRSCTSGHLSNHPLDPTAAAVPVVGMGCTGKASKKAQDESKSKSKKREVEVVVA